MDDDLLVPAAEPQIAVVIDPHNVASVEPILADNFGACAGIVPIAGGARRRPHEETPFRAARDFAPILAADREHETRARHPDRAELIHHRRRIERGQTNLGQP